MPTLRAHDGRTCRYAHLQQRWLCRTPMRTLRWNGRRVGAQRDALSLCAHPAAPGWRKRIMPALKKHTYEEAGAMLGGTDPLSTRTIERMVEAGDLERIGNRMRRRISERSIEAYEQGERGIWRDDQQAAARAARQAAATREQ